MLSARESELRRAARTSAVSARRLGADAAAQSEQEVGIGADGLPQVALGERADAVDAAAGAEVGAEQLQVQVRRPAAVLLRRRR